MINGGVEGMCKVSPQLGQMTSWDDRPVSPCPSLGEGIQGSRDSPTEGVGREDDSFRTHPYLR